MSFLFIKYFEHIINNKMWSINVLQHGERDYSAFICVLNGPLTFVTTRRLFSFLRPTKAFA